mgnify:CR=1 FL=1
MTKNRQGLKLPVYTNSAIGGIVNQEEYFDSLFKYKIDKQQRVAILTDDDNNLTAFTFPKLLLTSVIFKISSI